MILPLINYDKNRNCAYRGVMPFSPLMWQAEADIELTLSAPPVTAVGQKALALAKKALSHGNNNFDIAITTLEGL